jgi:hypothetical protein
LTSPSAALLSTSIACIIDLHLRASVDFDGLSCSRVGLELVAFCHSVFSKHQRKVSCLLFASA